MVQFDEHIVQAGSPMGTQAAPQHCCVPLHAWPHVMQLALSPRGSTQRPVQQSWPLPHTVPHAPQFIGSFAVSAHMRLQHVRAVQVARHAPQFISSLASSTQRPLQHDWPMPHAIPQSPQFMRSVAKLKFSSVAPSQSSSW